MTPLFSRKILRCGVLATVFVACALTIILILAKARHSPLERMPGPGCGDFVVSLPGGYSLAKTSAQNAQVFDDQTCQHTIPAHIEALDYDHDFLIARQCGDEDYSTRPGQEGEPLRFHYWLIRFSDRQIEGPMTEAAFHARRKTLGISKALQWRSVDDFRPKEQSLWVWAFVALVVAPTSIMAAFVIILFISRRKA